MSMKTAKFADQIIIDFVEQRFKNFNYGVNTIVDLFKTIESVSLWELKGMFSAPELNAMVDVTNATCVDKSWISSGGLIADLEDADRLNSLGSKWEIDVKNLCDRLRSMSKIQVYFLADWAHRYWCGNEELPDLNEYIKSLL